MIELIKTNTSYYCITNSTQDFFDKVSNLTLEKVIKGLPDSYKGHIISKNYIKILFEHSLVYECNDLIKFEKELIESINKELNKTA